MYEFLKFYKWGMEVKMYMAIYTVALLGTKCVFELLFGNRSVDIAVVFEMLIICFLVSLIQRAFFPASAEFEKKPLINRTALWALLTNALFIGPAIFFRWFPHIPAWGFLILLLLLEGGLIAMWVGFYIVQKIDTKKLNEKLGAYQKNS